MDDLIRVRYRNKREGLVDDVTLNELILSRKIKHFYRPSEDRWVNIDTDPIRKKPRLQAGPRRRQSFKESLDRKYGEFLPKFFLRKGERELSAADWFETGFSLLFTSGDYEEAIGAFSCAIQIDPGFSRAYLDRGMAYERIGNVQQALEDYNRAIELLPDDAKAYYLRGLTFWRSGRENKAKGDLEKAAELGYPQANSFLKLGGFEAARP